MENLIVHFSTTSRIGEYMILCKGGWQKLPPGECSRKEGMITCPDCAEILIPRFEATLRILRSVVNKPGVIDNGPL